jgi:hypothetical protein
MGTTLPVGPVGSSSREPYQGHSIQLYTAFYFFGNDGIRINGLMPDVGVPPLRTVAFSHGRRLTNDFERARRGSADDLLQF